MLTGLALEAGLARAWVQIPEIVLAARMPVRSFSVEAVGDQTRSRSCACGRDEIFQRHVGTARLFLRQARLSAFDEDLAIFEAERPHASSLALS